MGDIQQTDRAADTASATRGMTRRSVVRTGAAAAWSVPVITVVAAAPAFAASGPAAITTTIASAYRHPSNLQKPNVLDRLSVISNFSNANTQPTTAFRVLVSLTPTGTGNPAPDFKNSIVQTVPAGYALTGQYADGKSIYFLFTKAVQIQGNAAVNPFNPVFDLKPKEGPGQITITPTTTTGTASGASANFV